MAVWSLDGPEGAFEQNVSVGEDIWERSLEVDLIKMKNHLKKREAELWLLQLHSTLLISLLVLFFFALLLWAISGWFDH